MTDRVSIQNPGSRLNGVELIRLGEVRSLTGWSRNYVKKLRLAGVLRTLQPPRSRAFYYRSQILKMISGSHNEDNKQ